MNKEKVLKNNKLFAFVPNKVLGTIAPLFKEHFPERAQAVIEHGEPAHLFFLVHKGKIKTLYQHHDEHEMSAGDYFGEMALLGEKSTVVNAFALQSGTTLLSITKTDFSHCLDAFPVLQTVMTNLVAERLGTIGLGGSERMVGNYAVEEEIRREEKEVWFRGEHTLLGRSVRMHLVPHLFIRDTKYRERLLNKLKLIANLDSPHIVKPLDVVRAWNSFFVIYDHDNGIPLSEIIRASRSIPHQIISVIVLRIAEILASLHSQELVHADLRPQNIFVTRAGEIRLANVGMMHPDFLTPEYMSPEQMQKKHAGKSTDVYSLGVIAYCLCAQKFPFDAKDGETLLKQKLKGEYTDLVAINPLLPVPLVQFVGRALEARPDKRLENLSGLRDLWNLWINAGEQTGKEEESKKTRLFATQEQLVQWLSRKYFNNDPPKDERAGATASRTKRNGKEHFSALFDKQEDFFAFKLLTFEEFVQTHYSTKPELAVSFRKDEMLSRLQDIERERQELIITHTVMKKLKNCTSRKDLFDLLGQLLATVEKSGSYVLLGRKDKKIKQQAERLGVGGRYLPDAYSDHFVIEKAENAAEPFLLREKNYFLLVCPLRTRTRFVGSICVADRVKNQLESRMYFYRLLCEVIPVVELEV